MPFIVGGIAAMVALTGGVLARVDPLACLMRALLAFVLGWIGAQLWQVLLAVVGQSSRPESDLSVETELEEHQPAA